MRSNVGLFFSPDIFLEAANGLYCASKRGPKDVQCCS
jgi:hypothetical protein